MHELVSRRAQLRQLNILFCVLEGQEGCALPSNGCEKLMNTYLIGIVDWLKYLVPMGETQITRQPYFYYFSQYQNKI